MEEMNARVMENEVIDETVEVDEAVDSGNAGALVAGIVVQSVSALRRKSSLLLFID